MRAGEGGTASSEGLLDDSCSLVPPEIVAELDKYIIGQDDAKKAVAIALRNRWRRLRVAEDMQDEITPKNIIMIGPTGVGKTEISRRLARLARAPFVKVEASKFTEVGYVGRDVESIIRDLVEVAYNLVKEEERQRVLEKAGEIAEERLLDLLLPGSGHEEHEDHEGDVEHEDGPVIHIQKILYQDEQGIAHGRPPGDGSAGHSTREKIRALLKSGDLEKRIVEVETVKQVHAHMQVLGPQGFGEIEGQIKEMFQNMIPRQKELRKLTVEEARKILVQEAQEGLIDSERVSELACRRAEQTGVVFLDEVDKICGPDSPGRGPDVSREGVQRDLLPIVEGSTVSTKYGAVRTDHILFVASGAFSHSKPSDLMPEFQGRFPIRVELKSLTSRDFERILREPRNALIRQYEELLKTEGVTLSFTDEAISEIARLTAEVNSRTENIGARRLHTLLEKLLEEISFDAHLRSGDRVEVDREYVLRRLVGIVEDVDLSRFIL